MNNGGEETIIISYLPLTLNNPAQILENTKEK